jgi:hypothetical protein
MAALRSLWQAAKGVSQVEFKKENPITKDPTKHVPTPYPLKFKEDLGPTLDDYEKAKKNEDKTKYKNKSLQIITSYRNSINGNEAKIMKGKKSGQTLLDVLKHIQEKLV